MADEAEQKKAAFLAKVVSMIDGDKNVIIPDLRDDFFANLEENLAYQGFDVNHIRDVTQSKYLASESALHLRHVAVICAVFYKWGNVHQSRLNNMTNLLQTNLTGALQKLGFAMRGGSGYIKPKAKSDLNLPRVAAAWPEITGGLIHQGLMAVRTLTNSPFSDANLPGPLCFQHFPALLHADVPHRDMLIIASFSYPCMIDRIINEKKPNKFSKIRQYHELISKTPVLTKDQAMTFLLKSEIMKEVDEKGKKTLMVDENVVKMAETMRQHWEASG